MSCYAFADLFVEMHCTDPVLLHRAASYQAPGQKPDLILCPPAHWRNFYLADNPNLTDDQIQRISLNQAFSDAILAHDGMVLHASGIVFQGEGLLFSALSGVGKSTHTRLWQQIFGRTHAPIFNDDQPAIRFQCGQYYAYGTPFSGKSDENFPCKTLLKAIICLERDVENSICLLSPQQSLPRLLQLTLTPRYNSVQLGRLLTFLDGLLQTIPIYLLRCTPELESVYTVCRALYPSLSLPESHL